MVLLYMSCKFNKYHFILLLLSMMMWCDSVHGQSGNAIDFTSSNNEEVRANLSSSNTYSNWTWSMWIKPDNWNRTSRQEFLTTNENRSTKPLNFTLAGTTNGEVEHYRGAAAGKVLGHDVSGLSGWNHVAVTQERLSSNNVKVKLYVNSKAVDSNTGNYENMSDDLITIGSAMDYNNNSQSLSFYDGAIDEVRIWKKTLSKSEIRDRMCLKLDTSDYSDLTHYWNFDDDTDKNTLTDQAGNNDGSVINNPSWITSGVPIGFDVTHKFTTNWSNEFVQVADANLEFLRIMNITGNPNPPDGIFDILVQSAPNNNSGTGDIKQVSQERYWIVHTVGGSPEYDVTYQYQNHPGWNDASNITIGKRFNNASGPWSEETPDIFDTTFRPYSMTVKNQSGSNEYILASTSSSQSLPVELTYFKADKSADQTRLTWATASETHNSHFLVQKKEGNRWADIGWIKGHGTTTEPQEYEFIDENPFQGTNYYRLKQVDFDGSFEYSDIRTVNFSQEGNIQAQVLQNPVEDNLNLQLQTSGAGNHQYHLVNMQGHTIKKGEWQLGKGHNSLSLSMADLPSGVYFLNIHGNEHQVTKKIIK